MPKDLNSLFAFLNNSDACSKDLDGIQPMFKQVPPSAPLDSTHATFFPSCAALIAATYPVSYTHLTLPTKRIV